MNILKKVVITSTLLVMSTGFAFAASDLPTDQTSSPDTQAITDTAAPSSPSLGEIEKSVEDSRGEIENLKNIKIGGRDISPEEIQRASVVMGMIFVFVLCIIVCLHIFFAIFQFILAKKMNTENAWMAFIPFLNAYLLVKMAGKPGWWLLLFFVPFANIVFQIIVLHEISKKRGYGAGMTVGLLFLGIVFFPYLALTDAQN